MSQPPEGLITRRKPLRRGVRSMDFKQSLRKCHAAAASAQTTGCFTQVSGVLPAAAAYPKGSLVVQSVRRNLVISWRGRSRIGTLFPKSAPNSQRPTLKSTLNRIVGIGSDLRQRDAQSNRDTTLAETCAAKCDHTIGGYCAADSVSPPGAFRNPQSGVPIAQSRFHQSVSHSL